MFKNVTTSSFQEKNKLITLQITSILQQFKKNRDLGITLDINLQYILHIQKITNTPAKMLGYIIRNFLFITVLCMRTKSS